MSKWKANVFFLESQVNSVWSLQKLTRPLFKGQNIFDFLIESVVELKSSLHLHSPNKEGNVLEHLARSSSGPGRRPFTAETRVRFPYGSQKLNLKDNGKP